MNADTASALTGYFPWIIPECILGFFACVLFLGGTWRTNRHLWGSVSLIALGLAGVALLLSGVPKFTGSAAWATLYASPLWVDQLSILARAIAIVGTAFLVLFSWDEVSDEFASEYHACLLVIAAGACFTASANDLVTLFLALELISIPTYVLMYLVRSDDSGKEAAAKYFLLSVFSSALLLFGFSYLYGLAGTTNLQGIADALGNRSATVDEMMPGMALVAVVMVVAGLGFRLTAVPFHFYAPDVYQGTSTGAAALLAFLPKLVGFLALFRVLGLIPYEVTEVVEGNGTVSIRGGGPILHTQLSTLLWIVAAVTMTLGNVLALLQDNVKRLLAYSSVAHAGYMLIALSAAPYLYLAGQDDTRLPSLGTDAILFYLVAYGAMTIGAFAVLEYLNSRERPVENVDDLAGLSKTHPTIALLMALFMFSLIGIPATAGFVGKLLIFLGAFSMPSEINGADVSEQAWLFRILVLVGAINAAIGGWYYLRIVTVMYLRSAMEPLPQRGLSPRLIAIWGCALLTLLFGLYPKPLVDRTRTAIQNRVPVQPPSQPSAPK